MIINLGAFCKNFKKPFKKNKTCAHGVNCDKYRIFTFFSPNQFNLGILNIDHRSLRDDIFFEGEGLSSAVYMKK